MTRPAVFQYGWSVPTPIWLANLAASAGKHHSYSELAWTGSVRSTVGGGGGGEVGVLVSCRSCDSSDGLGRRDIAPAGLSELEWLSHYTHTLHTHTRVWHHH
eukprot:m.205592 g.205592  ORF g.205592 m.205592 type:complete len:102 (-) comp25326_c2_seq4:167-472(-)